MRYYPNINNASYINSAVELINSNIINAQNYFTVHYLRTTFILPHHVIFITCANRGISSGDRSKILEISPLNPLSVGLLIKLKLLFTKKGEKLNNFLQNISIEDNSFCIIKHRSFSSIPPYCLRYYCIHRCK